MKTPDLFPRSMQPYPWVGRWFRACAKPVFEFQNLPVAANFGPEAQRVDGFLDVCECNLSGPGYDLLWRPPQARATAIDLYMSWEDFNPLQRARFVGRVNVLGGLKRGGFDLYMSSPKETKRLLEYLSVFGRDPWHPRRTTPDLNHVDHAVSVGIRAIISALLGQYSHATGNTLLFQSQIETKHIGGQNSDYAPTNVSDDIAAFQSVDLGDYILPLRQLATDDFCRELAMDLTLIVEVLEAVGLPHAGSPSNMLQYLYQQLGINSFDIENDAAMWRSQGTIAGTVSLILET